MCPGRRRRHVLERTEMVLLHESLAEVEIFRTISRTVVRKIGDARASSGAHTLAKLDIEIALVFL